MKQRLGSAGIERRASPPRDTVAGEGQRCRGADWTRAHQGCLKALDVTGVVRLLLWQIACSRLKVRQERKVCCTTEGEGRAGSQVVVFWPGNCSPVGPRSRSSKAAFWPRVSGVCPPVASRRLRNACFSRELGQGPLVLVLPGKIQTMPMCDILRRPETCAQTQAHEKRAAP